MHLWVTMLSLTRTTFHSGFKLKYTVSGGVCGFGINVSLYNNIPPDFLLPVRSSPSTPLSLPNRQQDKTRLAGEYLLFNNVFSFSDHVCETLYLLVVFTRRLETRIKTYKGRQRLRERLLLQEPGSSTPLPIIMMPNTVALARTTKS